MSFVVAIPRPFYLFHRVERAKEKIPGYNLVYISVCCSLFSVQI